MARRGAGSITQRSNGNWVGSIWGTTVDGTRHRYQFTSKDKAEVERKLSEVISADVTHTLTKPDKLTVGEYLDQWMAQVIVPNKSARTATDYEINIRLRLKPIIGNVQLQKLTVADIRKLNTELNKSGISAKTAINCMACLRSSLSYAVGAEIITRNVAKLVPLPKVPRGLQPEVLEGPQLGELLKGIKGHDIEIAVALAAMTGMRMGEVLALRWSDVNFDSCILRVMRTLHSTKDGVPNIGPTKTHRSTRPIVIFEPLVTMLRAERQRQKGYAEVYGDNYRNYDLVCCMPDGRAWDKRNFYRRYRNLLHKLGLPEVTFHSLRHGFASIAGEKGVSMRQVSELLGHSQIAITADLYSHIFLEAKKETAGKLGKAFTEIVADNLADIQQKLQTNLDVTDESSSDSPRR